MFGEGTERPNWCEYDRSELVALLSIDYDALPERSFDPEATPRDKQGLAQVACACGCGTMFIPKGRQHKYVEPSHRGKRKSALKVTAPKSYELILGMLILVDPAVDHYETRELIGA
jgi:hypothetical protein